MALSDMALASNEKRQQRIMLLRQGFNEERYQSVSQAAAYFHYTYQTVAKWAKDGDIPLLDLHGRPVVPVTDANQAQVNLDRRLANINKLSNLFNQRKVVTVAAAAKEFKYSPQTIASWAVQGDIPLLQEDGTTVVAVNDDNLPAWLDDDYLAAIEHH